VIILLIKVKKEKIYILVDIVNVKNSFGHQNKKIYKLHHSGLDIFCGKMKIFLKPLKKLKNVWVVKLNIQKILLKNIKEN